MPLNEELNELLVDTFNVILKSEEKTLKLAGTQPYDSRNYRTNNK